MGHGVDAGRRVTAGGTERSAPVQNRQIPAIQMRAFDGDLVALPGLVISARMPASSRCRRWSATCASRVRRPAIQVPDRPTSASVWSPSHGTATNVSRHQAEPPPRPTRIGARGAGCSHGGIKRWRYQAHQDGVEDGDMARRPAGQVKPAVIGVASTGMRAASVAHSPAGRPG